MSESEKRYQHESCPGRLLFLKDFYFVIDLEKNQNSFLIEKPNTMVAISY